MNLSVAFLGTGGSVPTARRSPASVLIARGEGRLMFDCGEGTQRQLQRSTGLCHLDAIYLTHFHADHVLGLPGLLKTYNLTAREAPLAVHGPPGLSGLFEGLRSLIGKLDFKLELVELQPGDTVAGDGYEVRAFATEHRVRALGYALVEDDARGRTVAITGDTAPCRATAEAARGAELLVHDASFSEEQAQRAADTGHSTAGQAGAVAREAGVKLLSLVHISSRYHVGRVLEEAREVFEPTVAPRDFDAIEIPHPGRGDPKLVPNGTREPRWATGR